MPRRHGTRDPPRRRRAREKETAVRIAIAPRSPAIAQPLRSMAGAMAPQLPHLSARRALRGEDVCSSRRRDAPASTSSRVTASLAADMQAGLSPKRRGARGGGRARRAVAPRLTPPPICSAPLEKASLFSAKYVPFGSSGGKGGESYSLDEVVYKSKTGASARPGNAWLLRAAARRAARRRWRDTWVAGCPLSGPPAF